MAGLTAREPERLTTFGRHLPPRFRPIGLLGEGGMGLVLEAHDASLDRRVAIKILHAANAASEGTAVARMLREARILARLRDPHVVRLFDAGTLDDGRPFLVMELLIGRTFAQALCRGVPVAAAVGVIIAASEGLAEAHGAGILHRDLKPSNVFLAEERTGQITPKLLDFGIARVMSQDPASVSGLTESGYLVGSPAYMAPEQIRAEGALDERVDIWALGVILYEALAGALPFRATTSAETFACILREHPASLHRAAPHVPAGLAGLVHACLEKERERRPRSVHDLALALSAYGTAEDISLLGKPQPHLGPAFVMGSCDDTVAPGERRATAPRRKLAAPAAWAAVLLTALAGAVVVNSSLERQRPPSPNNETVRASAARPRVPSLPSASPTSANDGSGQVPSELERAGGDPPVHASAAAGAAAPQPPASASAPVTGAGARRAGRCISTPGACSASGPRGEDLRLDLRP